ncbi:putrescine transport system permease protein PotH [Variibacter gotjawalensis]|uniref:Putrescine transport system permease protein PotH n=1 Tax=Variibacter gotjawalensis TaxID=1333996 RepID=A0A0S3PPW6_9BRAD|nr:ABC transporter permease subunit [Variibacter gotjawalensis]NIK48249.1 putrescine transport system permease protein [Variibacter gotjawalensis]RZS50121.1 putrescine transport system permease protein [Variibacter gotjawalensis]BAT57951.1 putrescine transport system permease protein PotH [Variibacter gotjawalensis]
MASAAPEEKRRVSRAALLPLLWLVVFFALPTLIVLKLSISQSAIAQPPYTPVFDIRAGVDGALAFIQGFTLDNYASLFRDTLYASTYLRSLGVAAISTVILLLIAYPIAYAMSRAPKRMQGVLLMLIVLPFWTAFLIRVYAWINILQRDGLLNQFLMALRITNEPIAWLASDSALFLGIVYSYLPFMILPLFASLERIDPALREAAADLGAAPWKIFWRVTFPLSTPGVVAGALLCFIPIVGEFVIPDLLGPSSSQMIGQTLWSEFFQNRDWPLASALAIVMLVLLILPIVYYQRLQGRALADDRGGRRQGAFARPAPNEQ